MDRFWKLPPKIKVLEALGCIADKRISIISKSKENRKTKIKAICISSNKDKLYEVVYIKEDNAIYSNDNGSKFKGYLGYPSIALLMLLRILSFDFLISTALKSIQWKKLNEEFKNYSKTEFFVKKIAIKKGVSEKKIDSFIDKVMKEIKEKKIKILKV